MAGSCYPPCSTTVTMMIPYACERKRVLGRNKRVRGSQLVFLLPRPVSPRWNLKILTRLQKAELANGLVDRAMTERDKVQIRKWLAWLSSGGHHLAKDCGADGGAQESTQSCKKEVRRKGFSP